MCLFSFRYAQLCQNLLEENAETGDQFCQEFLPSLLFLLSDPVPNVRLSLARTLAQGILVSGTVCSFKVEQGITCNGGHERNSYEPFYIYPQFILAVGRVIEGLSLRV